MNISIYTLKDIQTLRKVNWLRYNKYIILILMFYSQKALFDNLSPVYEAEYNSSFFKRQECTSKTREDIIANLQAWALDLNGAKVYWINGMAGTGKTTIAYSFCKWLEGRALLGGNYFCSRNSSIVESKERFFSN